MGHTALGCLLGLAILVNLSFITAWIWRCVLANVLQVESIKWNRAQRRAKAQEAYFFYPSRGPTAAWREFAPYDTGSNLGNALAFWRGARGRGEQRAKRARS